MVARQLMQGNQLEALLFFPDPSSGDGYGFNSPDAWITNDAPGMIVVLPLEGEPVGFAIGRPTTFLEQEGRGFAPWVRDLRFVRGPAALTAVLVEKGLEAKRIGTIGALAGTHFAPKGFVSYGYWSEVLECMPKAEFVELYHRFKLKWLVKSEEELRLFRRAAEILEGACGRLLELARPGVSERDLYAATQAEILSKGGCTHAAIMHSGPTSLSWGAPKWLARDQPARRLVLGDVLFAELFANVGQEHAQAQVTLCVGEAAPEFRRAADVARQSYEAGRGLLGPGRSFGQVADAMEQVLKESGAWHLTPQIHTLTPNQASGPGSLGLNEIPEVRERFGTVWERSTTADGDLELKPGMELQLEPNAVFGRHRVNIGGNFIVTAEGHEELNSLPCEFHVVG